jgi:hypothetical protein
MRVRRVISDTAAWVERASGPEAFAFFMEPSTTPFVNAVKGYGHADRTVADSERGSVHHDL